MRCLPRGQVQPKSIYKVQGEPSAQAEAALQYMQASPLRFSPQPHLDDPRDKQAHHPADQGSSSVIKY